MGRKKETTFVDEATRAQAEREIESLPFGIEVFRLTAIVAIGAGKTFAEAASFFRVHVQTLYRWVRNYKARGLEGLKDNPRGHRRKKLSPEQEEIVKKWLADQQTADGLPIHWTVDLLRLHILEQLGVSISKTRLWTWMRAWKFTLKVPRPKHRKGDPQLQAEFKKKSGRPNRLHARRVRR